MNIHKGVAPLLSIYVKKEKVKIDKRKVEIVSVIGIVCFENKDFSFYFRIYILLREVEDNIFIRHYYHHIIDENRKEIIVKIRSSDRNFKQAIEEDMFIEIGVSYQVKISNSL